MKILLSCLIAGLVLAPQLMAQSQVNYSAAPGQPAVRHAGGSVVADGNAVWIGAFTPGFDVFANNDDPSALLANWHSFGTAAITTLAGPGRFFGDSSSTDPFFGNKKIYLWIFSTDGATTPAADFNNVNEYGLFSSALANWAFSPDPPPGNLRTINSSEINQAPAGLFDSSFLYLDNSFNPVPEPSILGLLSVAIPAVVLALRKRRSSR